MSNTIIIKGILNNYNFCISKNKYPKIIIEKIKKYFIVSPEDTYDDKIIKFEIFYEDDKYLIIPKFFSVKSIDISKTKISKNGEIKEIDVIKFECKKSSYNPKSINITFTNPKSPDKPLRDYQQKCINYILKLFNEKKDTEPRGGILNFACGMGKTIMAIYLASMLQLKTLIIVHQEFLQDQWIERIKEYDNNIFNQFGLVIYDEVHHLGSKVFSQALLKTSAEYTIGLSATPQRNDGLFKIINWHVGDILYEMKKKYNYKVLVKKIFFRSEDKLFKEERRWMKIRDKSSFSPCLYKMEDNLISIKSRNNLLINIINTLKGLGRKIFVFSTRIEHLELLKTSIDKIIDEQGENHIYNTYYYMGKTKKGERKMAEKNADIIFATLKLAEEGLDISILDTILFE